MNSRSPLSQVSDSGSAGEGTGHWLMQRLTAIALLLLGLWFLISFAQLDGYTHAALNAWVGAPLNSVMLLLLSQTLVWHSLLGIEVVVEDYVHGSRLNRVSLILNWFVHGYLAVAAVFAILKVAMGGSP